MASTPADSQKKENCLSLTENKNIQIQVKTMKKLAQHNE